MKGKFMKTKSENQVNASSILADDFSRIVRSPFGFKSSSSKKGVKNG